MKQFEEMYGMHEEHHRRHLKSEFKPRTERFDGGEREMQRRQGFDTNDYDWLDSAPRCITANWYEMGKVSYPKQQGVCGSCYAHSTVAAIETLAAQ